MLEVFDMKVSYGNITAVKGISFSVKKGECVALIGSNGAGKSTTLKALSGLLPVSEGRIKFQGNGIQGMKPWKIVKSGLIHVPEGRQIFGKLTVSENLRLGGYHIRDRKILQERSDKVFALFPILKEREKQKAGSLSGGEQQMLAIGRALMAEPQMLLLDEPSLGLAPIVVKQVFEVIKKLKETGMTVLLVEQNAYEALKISERAYILETGLINMEGRSNELIYDEKVKAAYLGGEEE